MLSPRILHWSRILSAFVTVQLAVQVMGFLAGVMVIRTLDPQEYAYFTIANTMQGTMTLLTDLGISISLMSIGGKIWNDRVAFSRLVRTAVKLRSLMAGGAGLIIVPLSFWLILKQGASIGYTLLILAVVGAGFAFQISSGIYVVVLRLHSRIKELQISDFLSALTRLLLVGALCLLPFNSVMALSAALVSFAVQAALMIRWGRQVVDHEAEPDPEYRWSMVKVVANQAPNGIYYVFQAQISVWLIGTFGNASGVAELGALGRLAVVFSLAGGILNNLVLPSFAKCQKYDQLLSRYFQIIGIYFLFCVAMVVASMMFSNQLLWILGKHYSDLHTELFWMVLSTVVGSFGAALWAVNSSRGWIDYAWTYIPLTLVTQVILLTIFNVSTVEGAIQFGLWSNVPSYLLNIMITWRNFRRMRREKMAETPQET